MSLILTILGQAVGLWELLRLRVVALWRGVV